MLLGIIKRDFRYWIITKVFKKQLMDLMGAKKAVIAGLSSEQREWVEHFIAYMNPASLRYAGTLIDHTGVLPGEQIAGIRAPTLVIHAADDTLQLYHDAAFAASVIPGATVGPMPPRLSASARATCALTLKAPGCFRGPSARLHMTPARIVRDPLGRIR